ncbi:MAG: cupredoxin family protein [Herbaspirillum sp.]
MKYQHIFLAFSLALTAAGAQSRNIPHHDAAIGRTGAAAQVVRTIKVDMNDNMRFSPDSIEVKTGDTIRFVVTNSGRIRHEMVFGTDAQLKSHYAAMLKNPGMKHTDANQISLAPGKSGDLIWQFSQAGTISFACLEPGHYDAGMKGSVNVASTNTMHQ